MKSLLDYKVITEDIEVQYEVFPMYDENDLSDPRKRLIANGLNSVNDRIRYNKERIDELNNEIDQLTNHADGIDNIIAVGSGLLAGLVDAFLVGEFNLERGRDWGTKKVNDFVEDFAKKMGYKPKKDTDSVEGAIRFLEKFGMPSDGETPLFGGSLQHHLRDFAHHPTLVGLIFSLLTQFTGKSFGTDTTGKFIVVAIKDKSLIGKDFPKKILFGVVYWFLHMISDMAGSSSTPGAGTGLPGPLVSFLKELSALPIFNNKDGINDFSVWISKLFNGTLLAKRDERGKITEELRFDLRAEIGVAHEIGRQAIPVIVNECIVRGFYFIRRLANEIKEKNIRHLSELNKIDFEKVKPWKNRTIIRMLTIATATMTAVDVIDATIRGAVKSGGNAALFATEFILRVNFVGVGRFAVAVGTDVAMGIKRSGHINERISIFSEQLHLMNARVFYMQANVWLAAEAAEQTINEAMKALKYAAAAYTSVLVDIDDRIKEVGNHIDDLKEKKPDLIKEIDDIILWG
ncbi:MAG TPA: hypothetical protein GX505_04820 [Clostridiales bacterium]|nr:hypothetical protein [Clostridiales bacterium]